MLGWVLDCHRAKGPDPNMERQCNSTDSAFLQECQQIFGEMEPSCGCRYRTRLTSVYGLITLTVDWLISPVNVGRQRYVAVFVDYCLRREVRDEPYKSTAFRRGIKDLYRQIGRNDYGSPWLEL
jgi:hypothetical protein